MTLFELTGFQRDLLVVIAGLDQPSGQTIKENIEDDAGTDINHGRLYPNLDTLVNQGLVEKGQLDRRTNYYEITDDGEEALQERESWEREYIEGLVA
ncbi:PadR family transcriptional regulator [Halopiger xanaduensis]|uniref:Transcriptional regulator PadR family protein n=1 Tax=Halopiger xanaduensis (strain DSM 18323 / JCM 14033 / SH-6) TaxID=797210 RepID=F8D530_HALXS|nr:PadR family transcriptional regulator [Halopiger xanaduensis]AEH38797.1 transcriptional regulator PadR family protein [Halopiger xanaduensis SH-6]